MSEKVRAITQSTLIPIGLAVALFGAVWTLAVERTEIRADLRAVQEQQTKYDAGQKQLAAQLADMSQTLARIEERITAHMKETKP